MATLSRIYPRLALSFGGVIAGALFSTALLTLSLVARAGEDQLARDMDRVAGVISRFGPTLSDPLLHRLAEVLGSEVVIIDGSGEIVSASLPAPQWPLVEEVLARQLAPAPVTGARQATKLTLASGRFTALLRPLGEEADGPRHWLALLRPTAAEEAWQRRIAIGLLSITGGAFALVLLVGHHLARRITRPIQELAVAARELAAGGRPRVAVAASGEVAELTEAFNSMVARLDETEQRQMEAERQAVAGRLAAAVAHEVRNPLSSIQMLVQLIRDHLRGAAEFQADSRYADVILNEIHRMEIVLQGLLDLANPRALEPCATRVDALVDEVVTLTQSRLEHRGITLHRGTDGVAREVEVDPARLKQVLLNLILNATDAMAEGGDLTIHTRWPAGGTGVEVWVDDSGHGVDPAEVEALFEPFQGHRKGGVGIGLAISRQIAREHGGDLALLPLPRGTRAILHLPSSECAPAAVTSPPSGFR